MNLTFWQFINLVKSAMFITIGAAICDRHWVGYCFVIVGIIWTLSALDDIYNKGYEDGKKEIQNPK